MPARDGSILHHFCQCESLGVGIKVDKTVEEVQQLYVQACRACLIGSVAALHGKLGKPVVLRPRVALSDTLSRGTWGTLITSYFQLDMIERKVKDNSQTCGLKHCFPCF